MVVNARGLNADLTGKLAHIEAAVFVLYDNLLLSHCSRDLISKRLHQIGQRGAIACLNEGFHRHPRDQRDLAEAVQFFLRDMDARCVRRLACLGVRKALLQKIG